MKIVIGYDHSGLDLKTRIISSLNECSFFDIKIPENEKIDYPLMVQDVVKEFRRNHYDFGILICGTGIGVSIAANKMKGIYCALVRNSYMAKMAREHNDVNFLALSSRLEYQESMKEILESFMHGKRVEGRHFRRVNQIKDIENGI